MRLRRSCLLAALFTLLTLSLPWAAQQPPDTSTSTAAACDDHCGNGNTRDCCSCLCGIECSDWLCKAGCTAVCVGGGET